MYYGELISDFHYQYFQVFLSYFFNFINVLKTSQYFKSFILQIQEHYQKCSYSCQRDTHHWLPHRHNTGHIRTFLILPRHIFIFLEGFFPSCSSILPVTPVSHDWFLSSWFTRIIFLPAILKDSKIWNQLWTCLPALLFFEWRYHPLFAQWL